MSLPRRAARMMLAASFIEGGVRQLRQPEAHVDAADPVATPISDRVPQLSDDTAQLVKLDGAVKVAGGVLLVVGPFHRLAALTLAGSLVPTTLAGHRFWEETDPQARRQQQLHFLKNLGLFGGLLLDALDTGGRPSIPWRTRRAAHRAVDRVEDTAAATRDSVSDTAGALAAAAGALGGAAAHKAGSVKGAVEHGAGAAKGAVAHKAGSAKGAVAHKVGAAKGAVEHGAGSAKGAVAHGAGSARGAVAEAAGTARGAVEKVQGAAVSAKERVAAAVSH